MKRSYIHSVDSSRPLTSETLPELWESCLQEEKNGDGFTKEIVYARPYEVYTRRQIYDQAMLVAKGLLASGIKRGEVLVCLGVQGVDAAIMFIACSSIGIIFCEPASYPPAKKLTKSVLQKVQPSVVVFGDAQVYRGEENFFDTGKEILEDTECLYTRCISLVLYDRKAEKNAALVPNGNWLSLTGLISRAATVNDVELRKAKSRVDINEPCTMTMTSGSTGKPKFVLTGAAFLTNLVSGASASPQSIVAAADFATSEAFWSYVMCFKLKCTIIVMPHEGGLYEGGDTALAREKLEIIEKYRINSFCASSTCITTTIIEEELFKDYDLSSLDTMMIAGCTTTLDFKKRVENVAPKSRHMYGMSECWNPTTALSPMTANPESVGRVANHMEMKIVDEEGVIVPVNTFGEIYLRGPGLFLQYYNDAELTKAVKDESGWFRTGDCGKMDDEGYIYVKGRMTSQERFKVDDDVVYPINIESVLGRHPKIKESLVVGLREPGLSGHELVYVIVVKPNLCLTADEVAQFAKDEMNFSIEWPSRVVFLDSLPRTQSSRRKVDRPAVQKYVEELKSYNNDFGIVYVD